MTVIDKRELILVRISEIATDVKTAAGIKTCVRNRGLLQNEKRPACVLLDGDERPAVFAPSARTDSRSVARPSILRMSPEMYILLNEPLPQDDPSKIDLGKLLNEKRIALSTAITTDTALKALLGPNGGIVYNGCVTDLKSGSALSGQMRLDFIYTYVFNPIP